MDLPSAWQHKALCCPCGWGPGPNPGSAPGTALSSLLSGLEKSREASEEHPRRTLRVSTAVSYLGWAPRPPLPCRRREICQWSHSSCCSRDTTGPPTGLGSARGRLSLGAARPYVEEQTWRREDKHFCSCSASFLLPRRVWGPVDGSVALLPLSPIQHAGEQAEGTST